MADTTPDTPIPTNGGDTTPSATDTPDVPVESSSNVETTTPPETSSTVVDVPSSTATNPPSETSTQPPPSITSSPPTEASSSAPPESSADPTSAPSTAAPSSDVPSSAASSASLPVSTSAPSASVATSASSDAAQTTAPPVTTDVPSETSIDPNGITLIGTNTVSLSTAANGSVFTVTEFRTSTAGTLDKGGGSSHGGSGFFDNTGAVAGVFAVVGLLVTGGLALFAWFMLRRRRRQRLDRDVAAAAAAAAASHHPRFEDDDEPSMTQYNSSNGYYASHSSHDFDQQPQMHQFEYEDPAGGYDPYAANLVDVAPPNNGERPLSTATAAGLAGFGASSAAANYYGAAEPDQYGNHHGADQYGNEQYGTDQYGNRQETDFSQQPDYSHSYGDPQYDIAHQYAVPNSTLSPVTEMSAEGQPGSEHHDMYAANYSNAYGGYSYNDDAQFAAAPPQQPHHSPQLGRPDSVASIEHARPRDLTVSNV